MDGLRAPSRADAQAVQAIKLRGLNVHVLDLHGQDVQRLCLMHGVTHVPCATQGCRAETTKPPPGTEQFSWRTAAPAVLIRPDGRRDAIVTAKTWCPKHRAFEHWDSNVLVQLPVAVQNMLPFDAKHGRSRVMLSREFAHAFNANVRSGTRRGPFNDCAPMGGRFHFFGPPHVRPMWPSARVVSQTKSTKTPTRNLLCHRSFS